MRRRAVVVGGILTVVISSLGGTEALSLLGDTQWSNYTQSWKVPGGVREKKIKIASDDSIPLCITKRRE